MINIRLTYSVLINTYKFLSVLLWLILRGCALPLHSFSHSCMNKYPFPAHVGYTHTCPLLRVQVHLQWEMWVLQLYEYLFCSIQSTDPHVSEETPHKVTFHSWSIAACCTCACQVQASNRIFCRGAATPGLCEGYEADKSASSGVRLGFHCCYVTKQCKCLSCPVTIFHTAFILLFKLFFSVHSNFKQMSL